MTTKIKKISKILGYKSFQDFSWDKFCKNKDLQEIPFQNFSIVFGENGSGKSSICNILKSFSQVQDFGEILPKEVEIEAHNGQQVQIYKYENSHWDNKFEKNAFLFFDIDFVNANVHTHGEVSRQQNRHSQNSGKLIIELDEKANKLKDEIKKKEQKISDYQEANATVLKQGLKIDESLFKQYKDKDSQEVEEEILSKQKEQESLEKKLDSLNKIKNKNNDVKSLESIQAINFQIKLSSKEIYAELFAREIKDKAQNSADEKIKTHFEKHKKFIETAKDQINENYLDQPCPLCMQSLGNAKEVIEYYKKAFDTDYENEKKKLLSDIQNLKNELELFKNITDDLSIKVSKTFDMLEKIKNIFEIEGIYNTNEKEPFIEMINKITTDSIEKLNSEIESLKNIEAKKNDVSVQYKRALDETIRIQTLIQELNEFINKKNEFLIDFKNRYSKEKDVENEINKDNQALTEIKNLLDFLEKIESFKNYINAVSQKQTLETELKTAKNALEVHLAKEVPKNIIEKMSSFLDNFNLNFVLDHIQSSTNTKEYTFSFKIKDQLGIERDFKDGLSDGERQLIALAFFFAMNENLPNKANTILIFDDPITSLDSPNLKILADIIHKKIKTHEFSQIIVLTHHPLFYKYLAKSENPHKFNILKNHKNFGGGFLSYDPGFDLIEEVKECNTEISQQAQNGNLQPEAIALKYGQLLRLAIEKFIKHDLLLWDKEKNFEEGIVDNLSQSRNKIQKLDDSDLETIKKIYKYCNHSNLLHADKENPSALSELITHIENFTEVLDKTCKP